MQTFDVESPRRQIAKLLSQHYSELAGVRDKPAARFSVARVVSAMATGGLRDGFEREIAEGAAMAMDRAFDPYRARERRHSWYGGRLGNDGRHPPCRCMGASVPGPLRDATSCARTSSADSG